MYRITPVHTLKESYMYYKRKDTYGLCIDWETSGSFFDNKIVQTDLIQGIQLGAAVFNRKTFEIVETLEFDIQFDESKYLWHESAEKIHGLTREHLAAHGVTQETAAIALGNLVMKYWYDTPVLLYGHNTQFDLNFTKQLMVPFDIMFKTAITIVDLSTLGVVLFDIHTSNNIFDLCNLPPRTDHNALEDVKLTIAAFKTLSTLFHDAIS